MITLICKIPSDEQTAAEFLGETGFQARLNFMVKEAEAQTPGFKVINKKYWQNENVIGNRQYRLELEPK